MIFYSFTWYTALRVGNSAYEGHLVISGSTSGCASIIIFPRNVSFRGYYVFVSNAAAAPPPPPPSAAAAANFVVSAITFEGLKLRSSNLTHALFIQISRTSSITDIVVQSKMAAGGHFVQKFQKKKGCVSIWNGKNCDRKLFSDIQNGRRRPFCPKLKKNTFSHFSPLFTTFPNFSPLLVTFPHFPHFSPLSPLFPTFHTFLHFNPFFPIFPTFPHFFQLFTTFHHFSPPFSTFSNFYPLFPPFPTFHHFSPLFPTFHHFSPLFITLPHF